MARRISVFLATFSSPRTARSLRLTSVVSATVIPRYSETSAIVAFLKAPERLSTTAVFCSFLIYLNARSDCLSGRLVVGGRVRDVDPHPWPHGRGDRNALYVVSLRGRRLSLPDRIQQGVRVLVEFFFTEADLADRRMDDARLVDTEIDLA